MEDQIRLLTAIFLIAGFLYVWFGFIAPPPPPPKPKLATSAATPEVAPKPASPGTGTGAPQDKLAVDATAATKVVPVVRTAVETGLSRMVFTSQTGALEAVELKKYHETKAPHSANIHVVPFMGGTTPTLRWKLTSDAQVWSDDGASYSLVTKEANKLVYERQVTPDVTLRKTISWADGSYLVDQTLDVLNKGGARKIQAQVELAAGTKGSQKQTMMNPGDPQHVVAYVNEKSARLDVSAVANGEQLPKGDVQWVGFESRYFLLSILPTEGRWNDLHVSHDVAVAPGEKVDESAVRQLLVTAEYPTREVGANSTQRYVAHLYAGPKDISVLQAAGSSLEKAIDLGDWLGPIARVILKFLRTLYSYIPNFGVAIILLTILVRLALFPLSQMQAKSMKKMQQHKPQMDALKVKHGDNKEAHSRELMTYMRTHRINPMGGCLLLLPQMPVFFALYRVLYNSIELRHAPFMLWIQDLSAHDPWFVTPVILGGLMFIQQKMTPTPGMDPAQATMMKIMPVMFSVFMLFLPAGLTLYILVSGGLANNIG